MNRVLRTSGFALVELAVVIVIVGLLLGGLLGAKQFRTQAEIARTIQQIRSIGSATAIFYDKYSARPGDLPHAEDRLPGCGTGLAGRCQANATAATTGDGRVGTPGAVTLHQTAGAFDSEHETVLFWTHLALADLIGGLSTVYAETAAPTIAWGSTHPAAAIGGGFHVKHADGGVSHRLPGWPPLAQQPIGTQLVLQRAVDADLVPIAAGEALLSADLAQRIDRKIDDGNPFRGHVTGYGTSSVAFGGAGCFSWSAVDAGAYLENSSRLDCGLVIRIAP